jgi:hypothetical protein
VITKTDLAKIECCFNLEPDVACKGAEKAFVAFAERISKEWSDESRRAIYGDDWFKSAVAGVILFRAAEASISKPLGTRLAIGRKSLLTPAARLAKLALDQPGSGGLDYIKVWAQQRPGLPASRACAARARGSSPPDGKSSRPLSQDSGPQ